MNDFCRYRDELTWNLCGRPAEMVVWGKLFPPDALGPRCYEHAAEQLGGRIAGDTSPGYAIYRIPQEAS